MNTTYQTNWSKVPPDQLGTFWFFGVLPKDKGCEPELHLVQVTRVAGYAMYSTPELAGGYSYTAPVGQWTRAILPQLPV